MPQALSTDILIVGGGIAGLWLNARLRRLGFASLLVENARLGGGQSVKSQGIIHGGTKYALSGTLTGSSEAIADMPRRWREALAGSGELDLAGVRLLSDAHYLWSPGSLAGNLTSFFASKAMRGRVDQVKGSELPPALQHPQFKGRVYRLAELVLDVPSQDLITRDNVSVKVSAIVFFRVIDPERAVIQVERYYDATSQMAHKPAAFIRST